MRRRAASPGSQVIAELVVTADEIVVRLSPWEKLAAMHRDVHIPIGALRTVRVSDRPWSELRGLRAPGTGVPGVLSLGTRRGLGVRDFVVVYRRRPVVVLETEGFEFDRVVVSCDNAPVQVRRILAAQSDCAA